jgi:hypothetical protein
MRVDIPNKTINTLSRGINMKIPDQYIDYSFDPVRRYSGKIDTIDLESGLTWNNWNSKPEGRYVIPKYMSGSDYSGTLVEKSNCKAFVDMFKDGEGKWFGWVYGGHGTYGIVIDKNSIPNDDLEKVLEVLEGLDRYFIIDEDLHSRMEMEAEREGWDDWARQVFANEVVKRLESMNEDSGIEEDIDGDFDAELLATVFYEASNRIGEYWINESGPGMYIRVDRIAKALSLEELAQLKASMVKE